MSKYTIVMVREHSRHSTYDEAAAAIKTATVKPGTSVYIVKEEAVHTEPSVKPPRRAAVPARKKGR